MTDKRLQKIIEEVKLNPEKYGDIYVYFSFIKDRSHLIANMKQYINSKLRFHETSDI